MRLWQALWRDEGGAVLSSEMVLLGTVGVLSAGVGVHMAATAVNEELEEYAYAIRSLDQSYSFTGHSSCGAWKAGSAFQQQDVAKSLAELCGIEERAVKPPRLPKQKLVPKKRDRDDDRRPKRKRKRKSKRDVEELTAAGESAEV